MLYKFAKVGKFFTKKGVNDHKLLQIKNQPPAKLKKQSEYLHIES